MLTDSSSTGTNPIESTLAESCTSVYWQESSVGAGSSHFSHLSQLEREVGDFVQPTGSSCLGGISVLIENKKERAIST